MWSEPASVADALEVDRMVRERSRAILAVNREVERVDEVLVVVVLVEVGPAGVVLVLVVDGRTAVKKEISIAETVGASAPPFLVKTIVAFPSNTAKVYSLIKAVANPTCSKMSREEKI